ncbi:uncharacterized protein LOC141899498 [Tubulanus polymorphus]|uniref:uncharacterized protein LOC141899498 n=1 Tax=Tubulanus polymorphus TaxID=672921 RepID=UPI003DA290E0
MCEVLKSGLLYEGQKRLLNMKYIWTPRWCVLYRLNPDSDLRFALFQNQHIFAQSYPQCLCDADYGRTATGARTINGPLNVITNLQNVKNCHQRNQENVLEFMTVSGKKYHFASADEKTVNDWIKMFQIGESKADLIHTKKSMNVDKPMKSEAPVRKLSTSSTSSGHKPFTSLEQVLVFRVLISDTSVSSKLGLSGSYDLHVGELGLSIVDVTSGNLKAIWPYKFIRRYAKSDEDFTLEAGRRCESGPGYFSFLTSEGDVILEQVLKRMDAIQANSSRNSSSELPLPEPAMENLSLVDSPANKNFQSPYPVYSVPNKKSNKSPAKNKSKVTTPPQSANGVSKTKFSNHLVSPPPPPNYEYAKVYIPDAKNENNNITTVVSNSSDETVTSDKEPVYSLVHCGGGLNETSLPERPPLPDNHPSGIHVSNDESEYSYATNEGQGRKLLSVMHQNQKKIH